MYKPDNFGTVFPYFFSDQAERLSDFLVTAFGAEVISKHLAPDGSIANLQIQIGDSNMMISSSNEQFPPTQGAYYIYVENADESMQSAIEAGAIKIMDAMDMPYQDRQGGVKDPCGNIWWVSQRLVEGPYQ